MIWTALTDAMSMAMDVLVAEAVVEFADDLREAFRAGTQQVRALS